MPDWPQILWAVSHWLFTMLTVLLLLPLERWFPRILNRNVNGGRFVPIFAVALATLFASLFIQFYLQATLVSLFLGLKFVSIAKLPLDATLVFIASFLLLDFISYLQHVVSHHVSLFWRVHAVHHADEHVTAVSGLLHHPLELLLSVVFLLFFTVVLGIPVLVFVIYGACMAVHSAITHADVALPRWLDRALRWLIVTPDVHRTHHSIQLREGSSNFGQMFTVWDRLFGTYIDRPAATEAMLVMGLPDGEKPSTFSVAGLLLHPFLWRKRQGGMFRRE
jgi:sterol desaturase/sphingolipid hydroxylase (fatty acid hydroxylase superfamily)